MYHSIDTKVNNELNFESDTILIDVWSMDFLKVEENMGKLN